MGYSTSGGSNKLTIHKVTSAGVVTNAPELTLNLTQSTGVKGLAKTGVTVTLTQMVNDPVLAEFLQEYATTSTITPEEITCEDGVTVVKSGSSAVPELVAVVYGGYASDGTNSRRKIYVFPCEVGSASGDETFEAGKVTKRSLEFKAVKWGGTADITLDDGMFDATLVNITDLTNVSHPYWLLPSKIEQETYGGEYWPKVA